MLRDFPTTRSSETLVISNVFRGNCGGNCPGNNCHSCPCGTTKSYVDIAAVCKRHTWTQGCCQCIVKNESGGNANAACYNTNGTFDVGVFQVNKTNWSSCSGGNPPCNVDTNLRCAIMVYNWGGKTWKFWSTASKCGCRNSP